MGEISSAPAPRRRPTWLFPSLHHYRPAGLGPDVLAGLTVWAILVPESLAYATIAGVSPVVGLYAAPAALLFYAAFGTSRHLVVGPMSATAALSAAAVGTAAAGHSGAYASLTATLAITVGVLALGAGLARLGFIANFISEPVLKGFIVGLALTIMVGQLPKIFGVSKGSGDFFAQLWHVVDHLGDTSVATLLVGAGSLVVVVGCRLIDRRIPGPLVVVVAGVVVSKAAHLALHGVAVVGTIPEGLPHLGVPAVGGGNYVTLAGSAAGIVLVGFAEGLGAAKTYARTGHYPIDANRELVGLGAANVGAGLSAGMTVNGSLSKTAVNAAAGARTQLSGLTAALLTVLTLLLLTGFFKDLPEATLAAIVIAAIAALIDIGALRRLYRTDTGPLNAYGAVGRADFVAAVTALLGVVIFNTLPGLFIGIAVSVILVVYRASRPQLTELGTRADTPDRFVELDRHPDAAARDGIIVLQVRSGIFFANAEPVRHAVQRAAARPGTTGVVLDAQAVPSVDVTAATMLADLAEDLGHDDVRLALAQALVGVPSVLAAAEESPRTVPAYPTIADAVAALTGPDQP